EFDFMREFDRDLVGYRIDAGSPAAHRGYSDLPLPRRARVVAVVRDGVLIDRASLARLQAGDYVMLLAPPEGVPRLDRLFLTAPAAGRKPGGSLGDFAVPATATMAALAETYGLALDQEKLDEPVG